MLLQIQPNNWSCFPTAFAMALDTPVETLIKQLGHDGSKEQWQGYQLAWHIQEIAKVCYDHYGICVTQFEAEVMSAPSYEHKPHTQTFDLSEYYGAKAGVAGVKTKSGAGHALAFAYNTFYNPSTGKTCSLKDYSVYVIWLLGNV
jgi:hypothetical protein